MLERSSRSHSAICAGDAKEDISVSGTGSCGFESRSAYCGGSSIGRAPGCGPGGWRSESAPSPHGTLAQSVESQTENLFAQVRFLEVPLADWFLQYEKANGAIIP